MLNNHKRNVEKQTSFYRQMDKKQMRIAQIGHKRVPSREGGIEVVVEELSARLSEMGHSVTCYNRSGHHVSGREFDSNFKEKVYKGIRLKTVFTVHKKGLAAFSSSLSGALCASLRKYDIVHFHAEGPAAMCWLPRLFGRKVIVTIHGLDWQRAKWGKISSAYIRFGERMAVRYADEIIVLSGSIKDYFLQEYNRKTVYIPNGVSRPLIQNPQLITEKYGLHKDDYILFLGRIVPEKGVHYLLESYKFLKIDKKLVIAGGISDTDEYGNTLHQMAGDDKRIIFTGFVHGQILKELYSNAYIYVLPSDVEGMPLSLLEAMSYGNCCLISDIKECSEVVGDYGVIFRHGDIKDLQEKLQMLCESKNKVELYRSKSADYICGKHSWDVMTERTLQTYLSVCGCSSAPDPEKKFVTDGLSSEHT